MGDLQGHVGVDPPTTETQVRGVVETQPYGLGLNLHAIQIQSLFVHGVGCSVACLEWSWGIVA